MTQRKIEYRIHAVQRMWQRGITPEEVAEILALGEVIEDYPDDFPYPSRLLLAWVKGRPLHLVVAENTDDNSVIVITVYQPDLMNWLQDYRERRK